MIAIGIDIGLTGAIAFVDSIGGCALADMPTTPDGERRRIDGRALAELLRRYWPAGVPALVLFEDVRPRAFGNGGNAMTNSMHSQGSMMRSRGAIEGVLDVLRLQPQVVQPQTWKRWYGLLKAEKGASLEKARALYPSAATELTRQKDHNRAEALLLAHYGMRKLA